MAIHKKEVKDGIFLGYVTLLGTYFLDLSLGYTKYTKAFSILSNPCVLVLMFVLSYVIFRVNSDWAKVRREIDEEE